MNKNNEVLLEGYEQLLDECEIALELAELEKLGLVEVITMPNGELAYSITPESIEYAKAEE